MDSNTPAPPHNTVNLHTNGYVEIIIQGDQSYLSFDALKPQVLPLIERLRAHGKQVRGLVDLCHMTNFSSGSNKAALELLENLDYDKVAFFGANPAVTTITNLLISAIGKHDKNQLFKDRASALTWLLQSDS